MDKYPAARFPLWMVWRHNIPLEKPTAVQLKTILNHVERHKSFVYQGAMGRSGDQDADRAAATDYEFKTGIFGGAGSPHGSPFALDIAA